MRDLLVLPATLLALIAASTTNAQGHLRPADLLPEHQAHLKREQQAQEQLQWQQPIGMRKMSSDEGEKFFLHYWDFGESAAAGSETLDEEHIDGAEHYTNTSARLLAPLAPHFERAHTFRRFPGYSLFARDWGSCPSGTKSCTEIDRPNSCCGETDACITVEDTGNGDVGCCPQGSTCGSSIANCDEGAGQTSCPQSENKGCCIAGYSCYDVGCVWASTQTTTTVLPVATATSGRTSEAPSSSTSEQETDTVGVAGGVGGSTYTTTVENTVTETAPGTTSIGTTTAPTTVTVTASPSETTEEPTETQEPSSTTSSGETAALPPSRPTGSSESSPESMTTTTPEPTPSDASCPTGFYMCSAHYLGGCCRVGRNCDTTSCPTSDSTELVSNGVTIGGAGGVAASTSTTTLDPNASSAASTQDGRCANGWFLCSESDGGGCCPADYVCGASCTAKVSGVADQAKQQPSGAEAVRWAWGFFMLALGTGVGMVWL
jgi:hypothetical protein